MLVENFAKNLCKIQDPVLCFSVLCFCYYYLGFHFKIFNEHPILIAYTGSFSLGFECASGNYMFEVFIA